MIRTANSRFLSIVVGSLVSYALLEMTIAYARERHEQWQKWYESFVAPFMKHPGRQEWLRETLMREEMVVREPVTVPAATTDDCGCTDAG